MATKPVSEIPKMLARRLLKRLSEEKAVVVTSRNGKPSRVFRLDEYLKRKELPSRVKPWQARKPEQKAPDPLGAEEGKVLGSLSRSEIYD